jgi:Gti1/Pac2 family transcription factor
MSTGAAILQPTFQGHVATTNDALILFEACLSGHLNHVPRRPHDRERNQLIRSGSVFIYEENASGIKRWTDGVTWSPSRILGNFLVYRELDKPFPPGEKKRAVKKKDRRPARPGEPYPRPDSTGESYSPTVPQSTSFTATPTPTDTERQLIGSLIDSYGFKPNGLVKKTMSVTVQGVTHHLVSYYNMDDVKRGLLEPPSQSTTLSGIRPRPELTSKQSFRAPLEEVDENLDGTREGHQGMYGSYRPLGHQNYFPNSGTYHPHAAYPQHGHQQGVSAGYPVGPPMGGNFMPQMAPSSIPPREGEYVGFHQSPYNRSYDSLHGNLPPSSHPNNGPPPPSTPTLPPGFSERPPPQTHHPGMYSQAGIHPRAMTAPSPIDSRAPVPYDRHSYSIPNVSNPSPISHTRALEPSIKYDDRREPPHHASTPPYPSDRQPYYISAQGGPVNQNSYQPGPPGSPWTGPGAGQRPGN